MRRHLVAAPICGTLLPLAVVVYNTFISPTVAHIQQAEDENIREVLCQMLMTGAML